MALKAMADNDNAIPVRYDAILYSQLSNNNDYFFKGIDDEMAVTYGSATLKVSLGKGGCVIGGRHVFNDGLSDNTIQLNANDSGYLAIRYDLTQSVGNEASFVAISYIQKGDINNNGTIRDLVLASYVTNDNGVSSFTDLRSYGSFNSIFTCTLTTSWTQDSTNGYYTQNVSVGGITTDDYPSVDIVPSGTSSNMQAQQTEWAKILKAETYNNGIKFYAKEATTTSLTVTVKR